MAFAEKLEIVHQQDNPRVKYMWVYNITSETTPR